MRQISFQPDPLVTNISIVAFTKIATRKLEKAESLVRNIFLFIVYRESKNFSTVTYVTCKSATYNLQFFAK